MPKIIFQYDYQSEVERVAFYISNLNWYRKNNYDISFPAGLLLITKCNLHQISEAVAKEYDIEYYKKCKSSISLIDKKIFENFWKFAKNSNFKIHKSY